MKGHVDASTLAEYAEDLLPRSQRARIASHLAACSECVELSEQLAGVSALLAAAPAPAMPAALAARLEAALAAEVAARPRSDRAISGTTDMPAAGRARRRPRWFARGRKWEGMPRLGIQSLSLRVAAAAAAAAIVGGGGYALSQLGASGGSSGGLASGGGASQGTKSAPIAGAAPSTVYGPNKAVPYPVASSSTNFRPGTLRAQIRAVVARYGGTHRNYNYLNEPAYGRSSSLPAPTTGDLYGQCVRGLHMDRWPSLVVLARYAERPAALIVFPSAHGQVAWVVATSGGTCPAGNPHVLAKVALPAGA